MEIELKSERLQIVVEPSVLDRIDDFRFGHRIGSRSEATRQLLIRGLEAEIKGGQAA
ncbi:MAG: hypothetical protein ACOH2N_00575 [Devosia sp.]